MRSILAGLLLFLLSAVSTAQAETDGGAALLDPLPDRPEAPGFVLQDPNGRVHSLADMRGQPVIVNFWATWCPPCRAEMPAMQRAWEQLQGEGIWLVAVNVGEGIEDVTAFLEEVPVTFPVPMDTDMTVSQSWPMRGLPTTFVVDPDGRLAYRAQGEREWDAPELLDLVRALKR